MGVEGCAGAYGEERGEAFEFVNHHTTHHQAVAEAEEKKRREVEVKELGLTSEGFMATTAGKVTTLYLPRP